MKWRLLVLLFVSLSINAQLQVSIGTYQDHATLVKSFADAELCPSIRSHALEENQILLEYLILCNAFKLAELDVKLNVIPFPVNSRIIEALLDNRINMSGIGVWSEEVKSTKLQLSAELLKPKQFVKGLYTTEEKRQQISTLTQAKARLTLLNENWTFDYDTLSCAGFNLWHVDQYEQMFQMLKKGRGDLTPITFGNNTNLRREVFNVALFPVEGIKLVFHDSTHFVISNKHPQSELIKQKLDEGIHLLQQNKSIEYGYKQVGIINDEVKTWSEISCTK